MGNPKINDKAVYSLIDGFILAAEDLRMAANRAQDYFLRSLDIHASAANLALRYSRGEFIVALDADCNYLTDAIEKVLIPFYYDEDIGGVGGNVQVYNYNESVATALQAIEYFDTISVGRIVSSELGVYRIISGAFGAFRKDEIEKVGGWDVGPGMDGDISVKLKKIGYRIKFEPTAVCRTNVPNTFSKLALYNVVKYLIFGLFRLRRMEAIIYLLPYAPLMVFYFGYFLRVVRTRAYFNEFLFKASYNDNWNPAKSSRAAKSLRI